MDISLFSLFLICLAGLMVGFAKTSIGALGILAVPLMATALPAKLSVGVLLPMLIMADIFAVLFYRRHCDWKVFLKIFPVTAIGVIIGYLLMGKIPPNHFNIVLGCAILAMLTLEIGLSQKKIIQTSSILFTVIIGLAAGVTTMMANAAGPLFAIYLLQLGLPKEKFVGTRSWYFLLLNCYKIPFAHDLNIITWETLKLNATIFPAILLGALLGFKFLKIIKMELLKNFIRITALLSGLKFIFFN